MKRRLVWTYLLLAAVVLVALEVPLGVIYARNERQALAARIERDAVALASISEFALAHGGPYTQLRKVVATYASQTGARAVVVDHAGRLVIDSDPTRPLGRAFASRPEIATALAGRPAVGDRFSSTLGTQLLYVAVPSASGGIVYGAVRVSFPEDTVEQRVHSYWWALAAIAGVVLATVALIGWLLARSVTRPLEELGQAAERSGGGDLTARAPEDDGPPEVRQLAERFNAATVHLERMMRSHAEFVADASHQLRTPLTALRLRLENLDSDVGPQGRVNLEAALSEAERLGRLVDGLLELARADAGTLEPGLVDVSAVCAARVGAWGPLGEEEGMQVEGQIDPGISAWIIPGTLDQILDNLLDNALQAAPAGSVVLVTAREAGDVVLVSVADRGPGMAPAQMEAAFERFWTTKDEGGSGLGLPIVARLARASGGTASLVARPGGGLEVRVRLPRRSTRGTEGRGHARAGAAGAS